MNKRYLIATIGMMCVLLFGACGGCNDGTPGYQKKTEFVKVFFHEPGDYSIMTKDKDTNELHTIRFRHCHTQLIADVAPTDPMWFESEYMVYRRGGRDYKVWNKPILHVRTKEINGGGWDHGKGGRGQTQVIE